MAGKIFINYRRGDAPPAAQALLGRLEHAFLPEQLFMDVDSIKPGLDFVHVLNDQVAQCDVFISIIGKNWLDARDAHGVRRLDKPDDFVRIEIETALQQDKRSDSDPGRADADAATGRITRRIEAIGATQRRAADPRTVSQRCAWPDKGAARSP